MSFLRVLAKNGAGKNEAYGDIRAKGGQMVRPGGRLSKLWTEA
jgi:hypothetical protein